MEDGEIRHPEQGTPQGGVVSPLLSNIYLHEFDRRWDHYDGQLVRFADDLVILCYSRNQARKALGKAQEILAELGLTLNQEKTKLRHVREGFDFLGFTYREGFSAKHQRLVRVKYPRPKSVKAIRQRIKDKTGNPTNAVGGTFERGRYRSESQVARLGELLSDRQFVSGSLQAVELCL